MAEKRMLSVKEAGEEMGVSKFLIRKLIRQGRLAHHRIGERIVVSRKDIEAFLAASREGAVNGEVA